MAYVDMDLPPSRSGSDRVEPLDESHADNVGLEPPYETLESTAGVAVGQATAARGSGDRSEGSQGTSLQSAQEHVEEDQVQQLLRMQQMQVSPGHSELSRMERGSTAKAFEPSGWAASVAQALAGAVADQQDSYSEGALRRMEVDEQELVPDYSSLPQVRERESSGVLTRADRSREPNPTSASGAGASSTVATGLVPVDALGPMVAQMMQPWMEQVMNNQVLMMSRLEQFELTRLQLEQQSVGLQRREEELRARELEASHLQRESRLFVSTQGAVDQGVPAHMIDWDASKGNLHSPPALPASFSKGQREGAAPEVPEHHHSSAQAQSPKDNASTTSPHAGQGKLLGDIFSGRAASPFKRIVQGSGSARGKLRDASRTPSPQKRRSPAHSLGPRNLPKPQPIEDHPRSSATEPRRSMRDFVGRELRKRIPSPRVRATKLRGFWTFRVRG